LANPLTTRFTADRLPAGRQVTIHAAWSPGEVRVAAITDRALVDYALWRPGAPDGVGDIYRARISSIVPAMAGAFITLSGNVAGAMSLPANAEGFLPDSEGAKGLKEGAIITVRVTRAAQGGKGPRLSTRDAALEYSCEGSTLGLLHRGIDPLREFAARYPTAEILVDDPALAASLRADLGDRLRRVSTAFDDGIETEVEGLASPEVTLASGVRISVHPTPALVAIDVDAGGALVGRDGAARRHLTLNISVLPEIARQIRLRNLSGAILVDLAGMKAKQRKTLAPALAAALADDPLRPRLLGFTALGLAEIARPRVRPPLNEALAGPLASGLLGLRTIARESRAEPGRRLALRASPAVITALQADKGALTDLARITGRGLNSRSDPSLPGDTWHIEALDG
jgi:Ribonuclease G/E